MKLEKRKIMKGGEKERDREREKEREKDIEREREREYIAKFFSVI